MPFEVYAYMATGAANTLFNLILFAVFYLMVAKNNVFAVELATVISFTITVLTGFWLSKNFTFTNASNQKNEQLKQLVAEIALKNRVLKKSLNGTDSNGADI